jgi:hypothetical protein
MPLARLTCILAAVALLAGCGDNAAPPSAATPAPTPSATPAPALTSPDDVAACAQLEQVIRAVSQLVGHTTEGITQATHPKELAEQVGTARRSLLDSAKLIELVEAPEPLAGSQRQFVRGLRMFAADFARGEASAAKGDMAKATEQLTDEAALRKIQTSAKRIDDRCGA